MFEKILIANRGEIAVRIATACRGLGVRSAAIYSEAAAAALHVTVADEAHPCGPPPVSESYLDMERVVEIARMCGADAVHPGYGLLSENADFADLFRAKGLVFIGPSGDAIRAMGDKITARRSMQAAGVAIVPGTTESLSDDEAERWAERIGLPVMVKASAGGGGKGMRLVPESRPIRLLAHFNHTFVLRDFPRLVFVELTNLIEVCLDIVTRIKCAADAYLPASMIKVTHHDRYIGRTGDVIETGFPVVCFSAGTFRGQGQNIVLGAGK